MIHPVCDVAPRSFRVPPAGAGNEFPPLLDVVQVMDIARRDEHKSAGRQGAVAAFGPCDITGLAYEAVELRVGHVVAVDPEAIDRDLAHRALFDAEGFRAHLEAARLDPDHAISWKRWPIIDAQADIWRRRDGPGPPPSRNRQRSDADGSESNKVRTHGRHVPDQFAQ